jgi:hypothetical protein
MPTPRTNVVVASIVRRPLRLQRAIRRLRRKIGTPERSEGPLKPLNTALKTTDWFLARADLLSLTRTRRLERGALNVLGADSGLKVVSAVSVTVGWLPHEVLKSLREPKHADG